MSEYNTEWFKMRAISSIRPLAPHEWDYSDSLLLYSSPAEVEEYESLQENGSPYFKLVTEPERKYLESIAAELSNALPPKFEYIDLGPGTEHKEQFIFDELKKQGKEFTYIPVDISDYYLRLAEAHASKQGVPVRPVQAPFEEVGKMLGEATVPRFVNIGLTFTNYDPQAALGMLKNIAGKDGCVFINVQIRDRVNMKSLQEIYSKDALTLADGKLKLIGLNPDLDVTPRHADDHIKAWCSIINPSSELKALGIDRGDKLLVFQSLRYTVEQLDAELRKTGSGYLLFDIGHSFVGSLIKI